MRALLRFGRGGVTPLHNEHEGKTLSQEKAIVEVNPGQTVNIPLTQNIGAPCRAVVKAGQRVSVGEMIGEPTGYVGAPVHASVSGKVVAIRDLLYMTGSLTPHVVIENDGLYEVISSLVPHDFNEAMSMPPDELRKIVQDGGVVGAGGPSLPKQ